MAMHFKVKIALKLAVINNFKKFSGALSPALVKKVIKKGRVKREREGSRAGISYRHSIGTGCLYCFVHLISKHVLFCVI